MAGYRSVETPVTQMLISFLSICHAEVTQKICAELYELNN